MIPVCLALSAHRPRRLRGYTYFDVGRRHDYFDAHADRDRFRRADALCYAPATKMLAELLERHPGFSFCLSLSAPLLDGLADAAPGRIEAFRRLGETGRVELLCETSQHCLPWPASDAELEAGIREHRDRIRRQIGGEPSVFGGEDPADPTGLARAARAAGLSGMLIGGAYEVPSAADRRRVFGISDLEGFAVLLRDDVLSDEMVLRLTPGRATPPQAAEALDAAVAGAEGEILCLGLPLETFGLTHPAESGAFRAFAAWIDRALARPDARFETPSAALSRGAAAPLPPGSRPPRFANELQEDARASLLALERRLRASGSPALVEDLRRLSAVELFDAMALGPADFRSRDAGAGSPYDAYMAYRHALADVAARLPASRRARMVAAGLPPA